MTKIEEILQKDLMAAMKDKNETKMAAIRSVKAAIQTVKTSEKHHEPTEDEIIKIIQKQVKQREEAENIYRESNRNDLADKERMEADALEIYLPKMLTTDELNDAISQIIAEVAAKTMKDMGKVMAELGKRYPNQYDGKEASGIIKTNLQ